jgi:hypothetical protein
MHANNSATRQNIESQGLWPLLLTADRRFARIPLANVETRGQIEDVLEPFGLLPLVGIVTPACLHLDFSKCSLQALCHLDECLLPVRCLGDICVCWIFALHYIGRSIISVINNKLNRFSHTVCRHLMAEKPLSWRNCGLEERAFLKRLKSSCDVK